ncbi:MAG: hypothetical protein LBB94_10175 [Clostridiales bacterium]|jgi:hypothetical protein|nr:hypothetical protein [Clostridiales bacterium]
MKKVSGKALIMTSAAVVSAAVLAVTASAAAANVSGYEEIKQRGFALLEQSGNATVSISTELIADGRQLYSQSGYSETNEDMDAFYTRTEMFAAGEDDYWLEEYWNGVNKYWRSSDNPTGYSEYLPQYRRQESFILTENQKKFLSLLLDVFTGDLKNYFVTDGNTISVSLDKTQIPELAQSFIAVGAEAAAKEHEDNPDYSVNGRADLNSIITQYLYEPVIESYSLTATLSDDGYLADSNASVNFSGRDENGEWHNATLYIKMEFSDIGSTKVRTSDTHSITPAGIYGRAAEEL